MRRGENVVTERIYDSISDSPPVEVIPFLHDFGPIFFLYHWDKSAHGP